MKKHQINHNALTHLIEADAVSIVIVKAVGDTWALTVQVGDTLKIVMAKNSGKPRVWRKLDTLAKYLKDLGINKFHTDVSKYDPSQKSLRRPDSANTLKQTHKSHQSLQQQTPEPEITKQEPVPEYTTEPALKINVQPPQAQPKVDEVDITEVVKVNPTDKAIQLAKERWEHRRAKILQEENPRAK
ncbi:MAG: hypothetical protein V7749_09855 [Cocleimonas sp.]